ncbi:hypothetical protein LVJ94_18245 [Pendulispora rubella]|uniref:Uncharacterized protein n=1 Tax=Pendulispora rubella TaxID=2741070 RepID=A0ABZ2LH05_9BACT
MYKPTQLMRGVRLLLGLLVGLSGAAACSSEDGGAARAKVGPSLLFPRGVFDNVRKLTLIVYATADGVDCAADGNVTGPTARRLATKELSSQGCADGVKFCGDVSIEQSNDVRVFFAEGVGSSGERVAVGCSKAIANQDAVPVEIRMRRFIKPAFCGSGVIEPTEQCEKPDPICDDSCHTSEVLLSGGRGAPSTANGKPGDKRDPFFLWPSGSAPGSDAGRFVAFFGDQTPGQTEVTMRVLSDAFAPYAKQGPEMQNFSFYLPNDNSAAATFPPTAEGGNQFRPAAVYAAGRYYVVYDDDIGGSPDISLRSMTPAFGAEQARQDPKVINGANGEGGRQIRPSVALGTDGLFFIAWEDVEGGRVHGRTYNPTTKALGPQHDDLGSGSSSHGIKVATLGAGGAAARAMYVATWQSGTDIKMRLIGSDGALVGPEQTVNDASHTGVQSHPSVATLPDGRFAIVWADQGRKNGDIFIQRYRLTADGAQAVTGDQRDAINDVASDGEQNAPVIASSSAVGGSYVAAWVDFPSGHVRGRFLGGNGGALFNHVDGQETEFQASIVAGRGRANPTVAVGGAGAYVAIGWEDTTNDSRSGIYGRRFPVGE